MRPTPCLGPLNLSLASIYFVPTWGRDALRALISPFSGLEDQGHAAAVDYFRALFDLGIDGMMRLSNGLAGLKLVIATGFVAYLIEFARAIVIGREVDRKTVDVVLALAVVAIVVSALPALAIDDPVLVRVYATQFLLVCGAVFVIAVERQIEQSATSLVAREPSLQHPAANSGFFEAGITRRPNLPRSNLNPLHPAT